MPLFSVIVPVYNAQKTLHRCLDSLKCQSEDSFEVLMVKNGSKDASGAICKKYAAEDRRFCLIDMGENCGPSRARNAGLDQARGKWIAFVDSDDYVTEDYLSSLRASFEAGNPDAVFFGFRRVTMDGQTKSTHIPQIEAQQTHLDKLISLTTQDTFGYTWVKAVRREILGDMRFPTDMNLYEDEVFTCQVMAGCTNIAVVPSVLYNYVVGNSGSLVGRTHPDYPQKCDRVYRAWKALLGDHEKKNDILLQKANASAFRCMYYCYEREVDVKNFARLLADSEFFAAHTNWNQFDRLVKEHRYVRLWLERAKYRTKNKIAGFLRG